MPEDREIKANIFDIKRFSYNDGPGVRTVVFFKGCGMRCFWCQNPESIGSGTDILYYKDKCIACGNCIKHCPKKCFLFNEDQRIVYNREGCDKCGICCHTCYAEALQKIGEEIDTDKILDILKDDLKIMELSGGGVTLSGGEPLLQADASLEILRKTKELGLTTAIETALCVPLSSVEAILPYLDYMMLDIKTLDPKAHTEYCGADNGTILSNLEMLKDKTGFELSVRIPVVPTINDTNEDIKGISELVKDFAALKTIELIPFHSIGRGKYRAMGIPYAAEHIEPPSKQKIDELNEIVYLI